MDTINITTTCSIIKFKIDDNIYQLTWWNVKGKKETNAIGLREIESNQFEDERKYQHNLNNEVFFMRFNCDLNQLIKPVKLIWKWYDNDNSIYKDFQNDRSVIYELEASFLANEKNNFDPHQFKHKFNNTFLSELTKMRSNIDTFNDETKINKAYALRCTFNCRQ